MVLNLHANSSQCYKEDGTSKNPDCPVCSKSLNKLAQPLPMAHCANSRLVCKISGEVMNENNPPMMLPNGYVYGYNVSTLKTSCHPGHSDYKLKLFLPFLCCLKCTVRTRKSHTALKWLLLCLIYCFFSHLSSISVSSVHPPRWQSGVSKNQRSLQLLSGWEGLYHVITQTNPSEY